MRYRQFLLGNLRFLGFGITLSVLSSFGQTFFIALFGTEIRAGFALTHGEFGSIYSAATLGSAACLAWLGSKADAIDLRTWSAALCLGLAGACAATASVAGPLALGAAIFGLRLFGQGLMSHASTVSMARYFEAARGRAVSIAALGHPVGEALLPLPAVALVALVGWRETWALAAATIALAGLPVTLWLLRGHAARHRRWADAIATRAGSASGARESRSRAEVLRDPIFWLLLPASLTSSYVVTGLFFHQTHVAQVKGWPLALLAGSFTAYALASVATSLAAGHFVDRFGATRVMPYALGPLAIGLLVLALGSHILIAPAYMLLVGASQGIQVTVQGAIWAEIYGVRHLGAIRALVSAFSVFASALAPATMGWLVDAGTSVERIALGSTAWIAIALSVALWGLRLHRKRLTR